jgi:Tfp pilus assembly protein FimT
MVTIALLGISLALAVPSFQSMIEKRELTSNAEQIAAFLNSAQGAAMRNNQPVTVSYSRDHQCIGAILGGTGCSCAQTDPNAADYCRIGPGSQPYVLDSSLLNGLEMMHDATGDGAYAFDPDRGILDDMEDSLAMELRSPGGDYRLNVLVNTVGRVIVCSHDSHAIPGYANCPDAGSDSGDTDDGTTDPTDPGPIGPGGVIY